MILLTSEGEHNLQVFNFKTRAVFDRVIQKDIMCRFEDDLIKRYGICMWSHPHEIRERITAQQIQAGRLIPYIYTLPYGGGFDKLEKIWNMYINDDYYRAIGANKDYANLPGGCIEARIMFVGEAPGWSKNKDDFGSRVYTWGQNSMMFRLLSSEIFGQCWYTNISKTAIEDNKKLDKKKLTIALQFLKNEIDIIKPKVIIALGNYVYDVLLDNFDDYKIYKIFHPSFIVRMGRDETLYRTNMEDTYGKIKKLL